MPIDPLLYHLQHANETEDISFWSQLAADLGGPILELGCGTGRLLVPLIESGFSVVGLDINFHVLSYLIKSISGDRIDRIHVYQSSLDAFHLDRKFSLIFLACNTLSTLSKSTRARSYRRIKEHLLDGGIFAASFPNPAYLRSLPEIGELEVEDIYLHPETGNPVQISSGWKHLKSRVVFQWQYDHLLPDGRVERSTTETEHALNGIDEYISELNAANLGNIKLYGDYQGNALDDDTPYIIICAGKDDRI